MSTAITKVHEAELVERDPDGIRFSEDERAMIRDAYARGANESQFRALIAIAEARGLDPRKGMVHFVERGGKWSVQPSIDYFRSAADATGLYDGQDEPVFEHDPRTGALVSCTVRVWRKGWSRPMGATVRLSEFSAGGPMWSRMPHNMLAKCAESQALRKAFPRRLGGLYTGDEMAQAEHRDDLPAPVQAPQLRPASVPPPPHDPVTGEVADPVAAAVDRTNATAFQPMEPVPGPSKASADKLASELMSQIDACGDAMALDVVARKIAREAKSGRIGLDHNAALRERGKFQRALLAEQAELRAKATEDARRAHLDAQIAADVMPEEWGGESQAEAPEPERVACVICGDPVVAAEGVAGKSRDGTKRGVRHETCSPF